MSRIANAWSIATSLVAANLWLSVATAGEETTPSSPATDPYLLCIWNLAADSRYSEIAAKLPLKDVTTISFSMLADESRPTVIERKEIGDWFDRREECVKAGEALHRAQWPPELFQLGNEGSAGLKAIGVELYNRKITFGEANRQIEQLGNSIKARMIPIIKQYQAELAAQKAEVERKREAQAQLASQQQTQYEVQIRTDAAQEQAARLQRAQLFMNYIQAQQQQLRNQVAPRPTYNTNCTTAGSSTNCTTH
jgi:hypothetical protein